MKRNLTLGLIIAGAAAGFANGFLGAGGGIILVRASAYLFPDEYSDPRDVFASALAVMLPVSAVSVISYTLRGGAIAFDFLPFALPALLGGTAGALLLDRIDTRLLKLIFALITVWSGLYMLFG